MSSLLWLSFVMNGLLLTGPLYMMLVYDRVLGSESLSTLLALTALMAVCYALWGYLDGVRGRILTRVAFLFEERCGGAAFAASLRGEEQQSALEDMSLLRRFLASPVVGALFDLPWTPIFFAALFLLHWSLGVMALVAVAALMLAKWRHDAAQRAREERTPPTPDKLDARVLAALVKRDGATIEEIGAGDRLMGKWRAQAHGAAADETALADDAAVFASNTKAFRMFLQSAVLGLAAYLVIYGQLSAGSMIAGSILLGRGLQPLEQLISQYRLVREAHAANKRLVAVGARGPETRASGAAPARPSRTLGQGLSQPLSLPKPEAAPAAAAAAAAAEAALDASFADAPSLKLEAQNLHYVLPGQRQPVLTKINFDLYRGEVLSVIGETGASKSLLGEVLIGRRKPSLGAARLGGREISEIAPQLRGSHIGYLSQSPRFLPGTVAETISRFEEGDETDALHEVANVVGLHEALSNLPQGYRTDIAEATRILPAGLAQRLYLARAIYEVPDVVVFDEPANNLGGAGLKIFDENVLGYLREMQCMAVILTQSPAIAFGSGVDFCMVLKEGRQIAYGGCEEVRRRFVEGGAAARSATVSRFERPAASAKPLAAAASPGARIAARPAPPPPRQSRFRGATPKGAAPQSARPQSSEPPRAAPQRGARPPAAPVERDRKDRLDLTSRHRLEAAPAYDRAGRSPTRRPAPGDERSTMRPRPPAPARDLRLVGGSDAKATPPPERKRGAPLLSWLGEERRRARREDEEE